MEMEVIARKHLPTRREPFLTLRINTHIPIHKTHTQTWRSGLDSDITSLLRNRHPFGFLFFVFATRESARRRTDK